VDIDQSIFRNELNRIKTPKEQPGVVVHTVIPALVNLRQEDNGRFKARLGYRVSFVKTIKKAFYTL
jgi:hypothetical protein